MTDIRYDLSCLFAELYRLYLTENPLYEKTFSFMIAYYKCAGLSFNKIWTPQSPRDRVSVSRIKKKCTWSQRVSLPFLIQFLCFSKWGVLSHIYNNNFIKLDRTYLGERVHAALEVSLSLFQMVGTCLHLKQTSSAVMVIMTWSILNFHMRHLFKECGLKLFQNTSVIFRL